MSDTNHDTWKYLTERYFSGTITPEELKQLLGMMRNPGDEQPLTDALHEQWQKALHSGGQSSIDWDKKFDAIISGETRSETPVAVRRMFPLKRLAVAATIVMVAGIIAYLAMLDSHNTDAHRHATVAQVISPQLNPGADGAILTLADGSQVTLDSVHNGTVMLQGDTKLHSAAGCISYDATRSSHQASMINTLTTPRGKQYQVELSDGTKVWLNAASSIRFPANFSGGERRVDITGEVYFEVSHRHPASGRGGSTPAPFIVGFQTPSGSNGQVQVLGTHFNINAYNDEASVKTTLLEGSVKVRTSGDSTILKAGQQAAVRQGLMSIARNIDVDATIAWKNGYFSFNNTDLPTVMRQIARWYDVDVSYEGRVPERKFGGAISRHSNAADVLKILEESRVHFRVEGRKIIVLP